MKIFLTFVLSFSFWVLKGQDTTFIDAPIEFEIIKPRPSAVVKQHKENLQLTLIIDSIRIENRTILPNFKKTFEIGFESNFIRVNDSLYIKIFIARNLEYGSKFYTWKWDYLKKRGSQFYSQGMSLYEVMDINGPLDIYGAQGHGIGIENEPGYIMYYYRYRLK
jgi:hypothetical protein